MPWPLKSPKPPKIKGMTIREKVVTFDIFDEHLYQRPNEMTHKREREASAARLSYDFASLCLNLGLFKVCPRLLLCRRPAKRGAKATVDARRRVSSLDAPFTTYARSAWLIPPRPKHGMTVGVDDSVVKKR